MRRSGASSKGSRQARKEHLGQGVRIKSSEQGNIHQIGSANFTDSPYDVSMWEEQRSCIGKQEPLVEPRGGTITSQTNKNVQFALQHTVPKGRLLVNSDTDFDPFYRTNNLCEDRTNQGESKPWAEPDVKGSTLIRMELSRLGLGSISSCHNLLKQWQHGLPKCGELGKRAFSQQEVTAKLKFQPTNRTREGRLSDATLLRRPREVQQSRKGQKVADLREIHSAGPYGAVMYFQTAVVLSTG